MLEQILMHLNNWFLVPDGVHEDTYTIVDGSITLPFLQEGQYFRIIGSVFNDGLYKYGRYPGLTDETFNGAIWALAIPNSVISLAHDIENWQEKNGNVSPYTSESFGGYTYTRLTNSQGNIAGWQDVFKNRLDRFRKIRETGFVRGQRPVVTYYRPFNPDYPFGGDM